MIEAVKNEYKRGNENMLRSMYSGISGLKNFQTKLDVIGNNVANVNTFGFKKGRTTFSDQISQTMAGATAPTTGARGGVNAKQVGLGASIASIDTIGTQGSMQNTGRTLDLAISGNGYFQVTDGTNIYYTRAGNFYLDSAGVLVNSGGLKLVGISGTASTTNITAIPATATNLSIGADGKINYINAAGTLTSAGQIELATFPNPEGLIKAGNNLFRESPNSGTITQTAPDSGGGGTIQSSFLEMSNVDLSEEFTEMIVAQRAFQSNTKMITTSDEILQELVNLKR